MLAALLLLPLPQDPPAVDFARDVRPILTRHCVECHGAEEQEGDLRLDARRFVFPADRGRWVVIPGKPEDSELLRRVTLPAGDDERMPNEGDPLAAAQIATLRRWIEAGAHWPDEDPDPFAVAAPPESAQPAIARAVAALRELGVHAAPVAAGHDGIEVDASWLRRRFGDEQLALLEGLEPVLVRLELGHTAVSASALARLGRFGELRQLGLARTAADDAAIAALATLPKLTSINLHGAPIGDPALRALAAMPALRRAFLWETAATGDGLARLQSARPDLELRLGAPVPATAPAAVNAVCPVTGKPVDPWLALDHDGRRIAFCCAQCRAKFERDPATYLAKLKESR
jgi:mono/diheme cytochrome c family protein